MTRQTKILVGSAVTFKEGRGGQRFLLVKHSQDSDWEFPKMIVRKTESSVRAVLRMMGELGGMNVKVLEEAGRASGAATVNGRVVPQKFIYYLVVLKSGSSEVLGFADAKWMDSSRVLKSLKLKREKDVFKEAKKVFREWKKKHSKRKQAI